ncbi:MAG: A24 family peptidase [Planctomycetota bacterium]|nr:A24 family peptidase [Planctomycetota bacterium]
MDLEIIFKVATPVLLFAVLIIAAVTDLRDRKVYNWLTFPAMAFGLTLAWANGGVDLLWNHFAFGFLPAVAIFGILVAIRALSAGDMKLVAAIGAIMGSPFIYGSIFWSMLAGSLIAIGTLAWQGVLLRGLGRAARYAITIKAPPEGEDIIKQKVPYGVAISIGTLFHWFVELMGASV